MRDSDRRFRNEPERVEVEQDDFAPQPWAESSWLPESNSARAALAATVRAWRKAEGSGGVRRGAQQPLARAIGQPGAALDGRSRQAAAAAGFGDLSGVRMHTDPQAAEAARAMGARAFTVGSDIFFGAGQYAPGTREGDRLLGHELAHAAQQRGAAVPAVQTKLEVSTPGEAMEVEADRAGDVFARAAQGQSVQPVALHGAGLAIARDTEAEHAARREREEEAAAPAQEEALLSDRQVAAAIRFNRGRNHPAQVWQQVATVVGSPSAEIGPALVQAVARFQKAHGFAVDGAVGDITMQRLSQSPGGEGLDQYVKSNAIVYLGLNPSSRGVELETLRRSAGAGNVTGLTGARQQDTAKAGGETVDLADEAGLDAFVAQFELLDAGRRQALRDFLQSTGSQGKDEMAQLAAVLYEAEVGKRLIKRMVISGHSSGSSVWGDDNGYIGFEHLTRLKSFFPMAMGQVEDLMLSACNTGFQDNIPQYLNIFPNLRSIWAYVGYSPSAATGSTRHIREWERSTRGAAKHAALDAGRERVGAGHGKRDDNVAVWTREHGAAFPQYTTESEYAPDDYTGARSAVDSSLHIYEDAYIRGQIDQDQLSVLYLQLQGLIGRFSAQLGDERARYVTILKHVLYLRHWGNITRNFMREKGDAVRAAYRAAGAEVPPLAGMSRAEVLRHIDEFPGDKSSEGYLLLQQYLYQLDPAVIPDNWN